jgi:hypothetical protein
MRTGRRLGVRGFIGVFESLDISGSAGTRGGDIVVFVFDFADFE